MKTLEELYRDILNGKVRVDQPLPENYDPAHLDCLLYQRSDAPVVPNLSCLKCESQETNMSGHVKIVVYLMLSGRTRRENFRLIKKCAQAVRHVYTRVNRGN